MRYCFLVVEAAYGVPRRWIGVWTLSQIWRLLVLLCLLLLKNCEWSIIGFLVVVLSHARIWSSQREIVEPLPLYLTLEALAPHVLRRAGLWAVYSILALHMWVHAALISCNVLSRSHGNGNVVSLSSSWLSLPAFSWSHLVIQNKSLSLVNKIVATNCLALKSL